MWPSFSNSSFYYEAPFCFECCARSDRPSLEEHYQERIRVTLEFALIVDNFDELVEPRFLYECYLGTKPSAYILKKTA